MARSSIGLDIGTRAVRIAEVQGTSASPTLTRFGRILLPVGAVDHGEIHDVQAVSNAIQTLYKRLGLTGRAVHVGMSNRRVVVRVIELPAMAKDDLDGAIRFQAQEHIPIPLDEAVMDYEVLEEIEGPEGERMQRVLVVAAERATIEPILAAVRGAGLDAASLELNAYPLVRCFANNSPEAHAIVDVGAGVTNVVVHQGGKIRFTRILPTFGADEFTVAIEQQLGVPRDEAEGLKRRASQLIRERAKRPVSVGAPMSHASDEDNGDDFDFGHSRTPHSYATREETPEERAANVIEPMIGRFATEVRGSLEFYAGLPGSPAIDKIVLTGGGALVGGIAEELSEALRVPVELGHPFERAPIGKLEVTDEEKAVAEPFIGLAVGLALAGTGN